MGPAVERAGRFELREQIADSPRGPMFLARDPRRRLDVLIQRFTASRPAEEWARYADTVAAARRAGVVGVELPLELVADDPVAPCAVLALRVGESVEALRRRAGALQWSRAAELVLHCAEILAEIAAATGRSHRALHPSALWLAPGGELSLLDLGVAELGTYPSPAHDGPLHVEYRAPEQLDGSPGDARSDVFTLGVVLCELTCGVHPFAGSSAFQAARKVLLQTPPPTGDLVRGMSPATAREAERLIGKALALGPDDRFQSAAEFLKALEFTRRIVGAPTRHPPVSALVVETPSLPSRPALEDPSTMLQIPRIHVVRPAVPGASIVAAPRPGRRVSRARRRALRRVRWTTTSAPSSMSDDSPGSHRCLRADRTSFSDPPRRGPQPPSSRPSYCRVRRAAPTSKLSIPRSPGRASRRPHGPSARFTTPTAPSFFRRRPQERHRISLPLRGCCSCSISFARSFCSSASLHICCADG